MKIPADVRSQLSDVLHSREGEFDLRSLVPQAIAVLESLDEEMKAEAAYKALKEMARGEDPLQDAPSDQEMLFEYAPERVLALGEGRYCRMADFEAHQGRRRREVVTRNYKAVARRWQAEDDYWERIVPQLEERGCTLDRIEQHLA